MKRWKVYGICFLMLLMPLGACGTEQTEETRNESARKFYLDAEAYGAGFVAAGTEGHLDLIEADASVECLDTQTEQELSAVAVNADTAVAVGEGGTAVLLSGDKKVSPLNIGVDTNLTSVCYFGGNCLIGTEGGMLLKTTDYQNWEQIQLPLRGTVTGLAANEESCIAVTDQGETANTTDGMNWTELDYNEYYGQEVSFQGIEACDLFFMVYGTDADGKGYAWTTLEGGVWSGNSIQTQEEEEQQLLPEPVTAMCWDGEQTYARTSGQVLTMSSCSKCYKTEQVSEVPLSAAACNGDYLLFAGQDYQYYVLETEVMRQEKIKAEAALEKQQNGALFIDVRDIEDYEEKHIAGAVHMDAERVAEELPLLCPNAETEIVFYCYSGKRSQTALEAAQAFGYPNVYNLGSMDDWEFDFESLD